jgi:hypothetical protein
MALTAKQKATMARHKEHHTAKHMTEMRKLMGQGKTFTESHKIAMKRVGK